MSSEEIMQSKNLLLEPFVVGSFYINCTYVQKQSDGKFDLTRGKNIF